MTDLQRQERYTAFVTLLGSESLGYVGLPEPDGLPRRSHVRTQEGKAHLREKLIVALEAAYIRYRKLDAGCEEASAGNVRTWPAWSMRARKRA